VRDVASRAPVLAGAALAIAAVLAATPAAAQRDAFAAHAEVTRALLRQDLAAYRIARQEEESAREALDEALAAYDQAVSPARPALAEVEATAAAVTAAAARLDLAAAESARLRENVSERLRTLAVLGGRAGTEAAAVAPGATDLSGRWRVAVRPGGLLGTFSLDQDGAVLAGTYTLTDGSAGSLRGAVTGRRVRLERVDRTTGFDSIWEGEVDPARRRIDGTWTPTILSSGGPGGGTWAAVPADSPAADDVEAAEPAGGEGLEEDLEQPAEPEEPAEEPEEPGQGEEAAAGTEPAEEDETAAAAGGRPAEEATR
jgi:hypothetical protein